MLIHSTLLYYLSNTLDETPLFEAQLHEADLEDRVILALCQRRHGLGAAIFTVDTGQLKVLLRDLKDDSGYSMTAMCRSAGHKVIT